LEAQQHGAWPPFHDGQAMAGQAGGYPDSWLEHAGGLSCIVATLARRLTKQGVNVAMFALPYHTRRKPRGRKSIHNFLSGDLVHVVQAAHQSLADARALIAWLEEQGCSRIGLWGISLGAWLSGLLACEDARIDCAC